MAAFGASVVASDRVAGAELLQKDIAKRRREAREAAEALRRAAEAPDEDEADAADAVDGDDESQDEDEDGADADQEEGTSASDEEDETNADGEEETSDDVDSDDDDDVDDDSDDDVDDDAAAALESDSDGRVVDPVTGKKRKRLAPALSMAQKRELAKAAVAAAEASGAPAPKVRKNGVLSLSELRRRAREAAKSRREAEAEAGGEGDYDSDSEGDARIEHDRILGPEDFKRIKALRTAGQLSEALDKSGAKKAAATGAEEMRRMLRAADKSAQADRRVNPDALAAVGVKRAHDKESRVASIMAGREDRGVFGAAKDRKNKKAGGTSNVEKAKKKNLPLAARVKAAKNRRTSFVSKRVKDKQFKGRFRK